MFILNSLKRRITVEKYYFPNSQCHLKFTIQKLAFVLYNDKNSSRKYKFLLYCYIYVTRRDIMICPMQSRLSTEVDETIRKWKKTVRTIKSLFFSLLCLLSYEFHIVPVMLYLYFFYGLLSRGKINL